MIVTHFGRLGVGGGEVGAASVSPYSLQFAGQATSLQQLRGYYSSGPSRTQSPQRLPGLSTRSASHDLCQQGRVCGAFWFAVVPLLHPTDCHSCHSSVLPLTSCFQSWQSPTLLAALPTPARPAGEDDGDQQHLLPWSRRSGSERGGVGAWAAATAGPQTVELMERSGSGGGAAGPGMALSAGERLRRRTRGESQQQEEDGGGGGGSSDGFVLLHRAALFGGGGGTGGGSGGGGLSAAAGELASAGGRQLQRWQQALACRLSGLKRVASQPKMAPPATGSLFGGVQQQLGGQGAAAVRPSPAASGAATVAPGSRKDD